MDYHMTRAKKVSFLILVIVTILGPNEMLRAGGTEHDGLGSTRPVKLAVRRCVFIEGRSVSDVPSDSYHGTGVILQKNLVLTNAHLLKPDYEVLVDGRKAEVVGQSERYDLALLSVPTIYLTKVEMDESNKPGQSVFYVGNPSELRDSLLRGRIVRIDDQFIYTDSFQDIASAMGASGSGLYSETGYLIGLKEGMTIVADSNHSLLSASIRVENIKAFLRELSRNNPFINWH
jgi:S1-C subfamily serine protease